MERPLFKPVGTAVMRLDTPALVVDLTILEQNIATVHALFRQQQAKLRPHVSAHRCPSIAHLQTAAGSTVEGISVTTIGEAEVFAAHGCRDLFVANELVAPAKLRRVCALARQVSVTVAVDHLTHVQGLSAAAGTHGSTLRVMVDVHTQAHHCGVAPGQPALELARTVAQAPHLEFVGLTTTLDLTTTTDAAEVAAATRRALQPLLDTRGLLERAGLAVPIVSVGGTTAYEAVATMAGVTEVRAGAYALMDARHAPFLPHLQSAARVLSTVTSQPEPGTAITDTGQKAIGSDRGLPVVADIPGAVVMGLSAEHCRLRLDGNAESRVALGDKIWLTPWDIGTCTNLYDFIHAVRHDTLEAVWPVAARGYYR